MENSSASGGSRSGRKVSTESTQQQSNKHPTSPQSSTDQSSIKSRKRCLSVASSIELKAEIAINANDKSSRSSRKLSCEIPLCSMTGIDDSLKNTEIKVNLPEKQPEITEAICSASGNSHSSMHNEAKMSPKFTIGQLHGAETFEIQDKIPHERKPLQNSMEIKTSQSTHPLFNVVPVVCEAGGSANHRCSLFGLGGRLEQSRLDPVKEQTSNDDSSASNANESSNQPTNHNEAHEINESSFISVPAVINPESRPSSPNLAAKNSPKTLSLSTYKKAANHRGAMLSPGELIPKLQALKVPDTSLNSPPYTPNPKGAFLMPPKPYGNYYLSTTSISQGASDKGGLLKPPGANASSYSLNGPNMSANAITVS